MCGIAGMARQVGDLTLAEVETVRSMAQCLTHRGPDAAGLFTENGVALAHRRLAIIDVSSAGNQPMTSSSGRFIIVFNGEIYNFRDLSQKLRNSDWTARSSSDTEVILEFVERWGIRRFLDLADGMFAIALFDKVENRLHLIRDAFGEKPLLYLRRGNEIYFASEARSFEEIPGISLEVCPQAVRQYFTYGYLRGTQGIFIDLKKVAPATWLDFDLNSTNEPSTTKYWIPELARPHNWNGTSDNFLELFDASVRRRTISDRPLGAFLSGGIDSGLTSAVAARHVKGQLKTFTLAWEDREVDESINARKVASALGSDHHEVRLSNDEVLREVQHLGMIMDEPFADSSLLATRLVARAARSEVVVMLSGDGGDELLGGYNRHRWLLNATAFRSRTPAWVGVTAASLLRNGGPLLAKLMNPISPNRRPRMVADKARKFASILGNDNSIESYQTLLQQIPAQGEAEGLPEPVLHALQSGNINEVLWGLRVADMTGYLAEDILTKVDRATMSVSLESRTAFLNRELAEWALHQPASSLLGRTKSKLPARRALAALLPGVSFSKTKSGFGIPAGELLRNQLLDDLCDAVSTYTSRGYGFDHDWSAQIIELRNGKTDSIRPLWSLLMFEYWQQGRAGRSLA